ncbi:MAG: CPBP family intramembrane metalloprotease [Promethearchaeota archaeon]|nr:MAG: CPBP family intramembrane metalloprotease [Candidatus Lokiarchaeota archaeon]
MTINLGSDPWILICLMPLEILLVVIPALISSKIEKTSFAHEIHQMGLNTLFNSFFMQLKKIIAGLVFGCLLFLISGYLFFFFKHVIIENLLGKAFIVIAEENAIKSEPIRPSPLQLILILLFYLLLVSICEEAFFRGFIIKKLESKLNTRNSILFSSLCFSLYHVPPFFVPFQTMLTFLGYYFTLGILISLIFKLFKNSLLPCIVCHGVFNVLILLF